MSDDLFSLADLAQIDATEIEAITSRLPTAGTFICQGAEVRLVEGESNDGRPPLHRVVFKAEVLDAFPADDSVNADTIVGKHITESVTLWPDKDRADGLPMESLGLLKGNLKKIGINVSGNKMLGEDGYVNDFVGAMFKWRIRHVETKTAAGELVTRAYFDWLPFKPAE